MFWWSIRLPRTLSSSDATSDDEQLLFLIQLTVGVLSHESMVLVCRSGTIMARTRRCRMAPASSRSELVMVPCGFVWVSKACFTGVGHSNCHTVGGNCLFPPNHTPPAPVPDASWVPMKSGMLGTMAIAWVGFLAACRRTYSKSLEARLIAGVIVVHLVLCLITLLSGPIRGVAPGIP